jgi:hypothetical protein
MTDELEHEMEENFGDDNDGPDEDQLPSLDDMDAAKESGTVEPSDYTQQLLLSYLISAPELWVKCAPIIDAKYFDPQYRPVIKNIAAHLKTYGDLPDTDMIHADTGVRLTLKDDADKPSRQESVCDRVEEFCRTTAFHDFLVSAAEETEEDGSRSTLSALMKKAAAIEGMSLTRNLGIEVHGGTVNILTKAEKDDNIPTGFRDMDHAFGGGLTRPSFNIVSCASGDGKSIYLQNQLVNYIEQGMNTIFYSLELEPAIVIKRFAAMMTNTSIDQIYSHLDTVGFAMRTRGKTDGELWVKKFPMVGTSMSAIAAHYQELTMHTKLQFGAVAIDYIDVMDPDEKIDKSNIHIKDKLVSEEMNDWTHKNSLILWSASQQTKGAQDEAAPRQSGVAGGTPKISTCDNLIIGKRNEDDTEDERWWAHIAKARSSGANKTKIPLHWDSQTMRMGDDDIEKFKEANPKLFGFKHSPSKKSDTSERIKNDPIAQELGVELAEKPAESGSGIKVVETLTKLRNFTHSQQDMKNDEAE